jgi:plasmid stabilization system protein ParE
VIASVSPEADRELIESARYYAREGGSEVGRAFLDEYERVVRLLCARPDIGVAWGEGRRRLPVRKFPYSVVYYLRGDELRVIALAHHRRKPGYWSGRD